MKKIAILSLLGSLTLALAGAQAAEQIPWVADFRTACGMAAEQHRLVLLHFYSDNCAPCVRLEQNVFSRADVGEAVAQNYLPVKVHVEKVPQLASRYSIRAWPTDVFVTPAGLELYRTVSPQDPAEYVAVLNRVAQQSASNVRRPTNLRQTVTATASGVALAANEAAVDLSAAAGRAEQPIASTAPWQPSNGQLPMNRRSAFAPPAPPVEPPAPQPAATAPPAAAAPPANAPSLAAAGVAAFPPTAPPSAAPTASNAPPLAGPQPAPSPVMSVQPPLPTANPWLTANPAAGSGASMAPASPPPASPAPASSERQYVPASQAPPTALDGFCPVTLIETMSRSSEDRSAWKKGNANFGAIHRGRTYLFTSAEQQQKFLANPDGYAPAFSGYDPVRYAERGELVDGKRAYGLITPDKHIFLFADEASLLRFRQSPTRYTAALQQALAQAAGGTTYR